MIGRNGRAPFVLGIATLVLVIALVLSSVSEFQTSAIASDGVSSKRTGLEVITDPSKSNSNIAPYSVYSHTIYLPLISSSEELLPPWLIHLNTFRRSSDLPLLKEDTRWSNSDWLHSRYMVKNDYVGHNETTGNEWYTSEGDIAARNGNVFVSSWSGSSDNTAIDFWMTAPFHAISILDPQLQKTGFGTYREEMGLWKMAATLDVLRGRGALPPIFEFPVLFPGADSQIDLLKYNGGEFPDPLASCPGYVAPTGAPILIQIGPGNVTPVVTTHELRISGGGLLENCQYDETNYTNPNGQNQITGRLVLGNRDAIVLMPRQPLQAGKNYQVMLVINGVTYEWDFFTSPTLNSPNSLFEGTVSAHPPRP